MKGICRRNLRWKYPWHSGISVRSFCSRCWTTRPPTSCALVMIGFRWILFRTRIIRVRGEGLQKIYMKGGQNINTTRSLLPTPGTKWVVCVVIWRSYRITLFWSHHKIMQTHVRYAALISKQPVACVRGHHLTSFSRKWARIAKHGLFSFYVRQRIPLLSSRKYQ